MAAAIEDAYNALLEADGRERLADDDSAATRDRRMLFVAISRGVVAHLDANDRALRVLDANNNELDVRIEIATG